MLSSYPAMPFPHEHDFFARTPELERDGSGSPGGKSTESGDPCRTPQSTYSPLPTPSALSMKSCLSIPVLPSRSRKTVCFSPHPPTIHEAPSNVEYDRTPHAVVPRLTYRDVLEMREVLQMTVELGIFAKRQPSSGGSSGTDSPSSASSSCGIPSSNLSGVRDGQPLGSDFPFPRPALALAVASEFPNSKQLVKGLSDMPLCPPLPAQGMGMTVVDRGDGLDGVANWKPKPRSKPRPLREPSPPQEPEEESEFAREVREARDQLALLEVAKMRERERVDLERVKASGSSSAGPSRKSSCDDLHAGASTRSALFFGTAWPGPGFSGAPSPALSTASASSTSSSFPVVDTSSLRPPPSLTVAPQKRHLSPPISPRHPHPFIALHSPLPEREPSPHPHLGPGPARGSFFPTPPTSPKRSALPPPTSPILAPFARSQPLETVVETRRGDPRPPSPILAPFARSAKLP